MTARPIEDVAATLRPYPIDTVRRRGGFYLARFTGEDPRYGIGREFLNGRPIKTRGTIEFGPKDLGGDLPAWLLRRPVEPCGHCGQTRPVKDTGEDVIAAYSSGWVDFGRVFNDLTAELPDLLAIWNAGLPGSPGSWDGSRCPECSITPVFGAPALCASCVEAGAHRGALAALPAGEVF